MPQKSVWDLKAMERGAKKRLVDLFLLTMPQSLCHRVVKSTRESTSLLCRHFQLWMPVRCLLSLVGQEEMVEFGTEVEESTHDI